MIRTGLALLVVLTSAACGFALRGNNALPPELSRMLIEVEQGYAVLEPPIVASLRRALRARGADVVSKRRRADTVLVIRELVDDQRILSVGADGKAIEYELTVTVAYQLLRRGKPLLQTQTVSLSRDYTFDSGAILAEEAEAQQLTESLQNDLAELILLRLEFSLSSDLDLTTDAVETAAPRRS